MCKELSIYLTNRSMCKEDFEGCTISQKCYGCMKQMEAFSKYVNNFNDLKIILSKFQQEVNVLKRSVKICHLLRIMKVRHIQVIVKYVWKCIFNKDEFNLSMLYKQMEFIVQQGSGVILLRINLVLKLMLRVKYANIIKINIIQRAATLLQIPLRPINNARIMKIYWVVLLHKIKSVKINLAYDGYDFEIDCYLIEQQDFMWYKDKCEQRQFSHDLIDYRLTYCQQYGNCIGQEKNDVKWHISHVKKYWKNSYYELQQIYYWIAQMNKYYQSCIKLKNHITKNIIYAKKAKGYFVKILERKSIVDSKNTVLLVEFGMHREVMQNSSILQYLSGM
ncbi:unnamed protein product [Paramecium pentaurelia]|uniref:Uncharacterized protein n=1 Tax=Paramecium pentaurelia TaxID=43138 RepID=A0A8S1UYU9_9CILI|nr:unnamed protein product [Paramecium pentaurelia]